MTSTDTRGTGSSREPAAEPTPPVASPRVVTHRGRHLGRPIVLRPGPLPYRLSAALVLVAAVAAGFTLFVPSLLHGAPVSNGNLRGTALVVLLAVPLVLASMVASTRGSARALVLWLGASAYLTYQAVLFCFATPMNNLFLAYVAWLGLAGWTLAVLVSRVDIDGFARRTDVAFPLRAIAGLVGTLAALNGLVWLARILRVVFTSRPASVLEGSGLLTSPVWVQDLACWIPLAIVVSVWMWRGRPWGILLTGGMLACYVLECAGIAADQWWGARADARHPDLASSAVVVPFAGLALLLLVPLGWYLSHLDRPGGVHQHPHHREAP